MIVVFNTQGGEEVVSMPAGSKDLSLDLVSVEWRRQERIPKIINFVLYKVVGALCVCMYLTACLFWNFVVGTPYCYIYTCTLLASIALPFGLEYEAKEVYFGVGCRAFVFAFPFAAWCGTMWLM